MLVLDSFSFKFLRHGSGFRFRLVWCVSFRNQNTEAIAHESDELLWGQSSQQSSEFDHLVIDKGCLSHSHGDEDSNLYGMIYQADPPPPLTLSRPAKINLNRKT